MDGLAALGWKPELLDNPAEGLVPARVVAEHRGELRINPGEGERAARVAGRMRHTAEGRGDLPAVGDWVLASLPADGDAIIHRILPRKSRFSRKAAGRAAEEQIVAANIDVVWICCALDSDFSPRRIERYLVLAWNSGAVPVVVLTKADLAADVDRQRAEVEAVTPGVDVHVTSCVNGLGLERLAASLRPGLTVALLGSSGVGKSTLVNRLSGVDVQAIGAVREDGKGRHTTTVRQLLRLPGGALVVDTPGMRELALWEADEGMETSFSDVEELAANCRFGDCRHEDEPGCAVLRAVEEGRLDAARLASYHKLGRELAHLDRKLDARGAIEAKRRGRMMQRALKKHPKYR